MLCDILDTVCDAATADSDCCTSSNKCSLGEGNCDSDSDCEGDLVCGTNNCRNFDTTWSGGNCCTTGKHSNVKRWHDLPAKYIQ